jgi:hypothetical protein
MMQASTIGATADTELNDDNVLAKRPAGPSVETIETPVATWPMART